MRPSNKSRSRNKPGNSGSNPNNNQRKSLGNIINRVFESAGPDGKVRGTPQQIIDKYQALARDAQVSGDRVAAESFLQHSEHYSRMLGEAQAAQSESRQFPDRDDNNRRDDTRRDDDQRERGDDGASDQPRDRQQPPEQREQPRQRDGDQQPRDQQPQRDNRAQPTREQRPRHEPQPTIASSLDTIDMNDDSDLSGLIETPENRRKAEEAAPEPVAQKPQPESEAPAPAPAVEEAKAAEPPKPKRGRPRRKAPVDAEAPAPAPEQASVAE